MRASCGATYGAKPRPASTFRYQHWNRKVARLINESKQESWNRERWRRFFPLLAKVERSRGRPSRRSRSWYRGSIIEKNSIKRTKDINRGRRETRQKDDSCGQLMLPWRSFGRPPYSWQTRIMRGYMAALIDLTVVCPTEGVKTGAMDLRYVRCLLLVSTDPRNAAFSSAAEISRSTAVLLSRFPFLFFLSFFLFSYTRPRLGNWPPPRLLLFIRSFVSSSLFQALVPSPLFHPHLLTSCLHASLNPFSRFPSRAPLRTSVRFALPSRFHLGVPASRFFGARRYCCASESAWLWRRYPSSILRARGTWSTWQITRARRYALFKYHVEISPSRFNLYRSNDQTLCVIIFNLRYIILQICYIIC